MAIPLLLVCKSFSVKLLGSVSARKTKEVVRELESWYIERDTQKMILAYSFQDFLHSSSVDS